MDHPSLPSPIAALQPPAATPMTSMGKVLACTCGTETTGHRVTSQALLGGRQELLILHQGREYRLRITQNGKLILTA